jgi:hypothetical protein
MTVLKNPGGPVTVEVTAVETSEVQTPILDSLAQVPRPPRLRLLLPTLAWFGLTLLVYMLAGVPEALGLPAPFTSAAVFVARALLVCSIVVAVLRATFALVAMVQAESLMELAHALARAAGNAVMAWFGIAIAYLSTVGFSRGRQLRRRGKVLLPALRTNPEWTDRAMTLDALDAPAGLADQWRENGKTEHASVAAFARLTLDLMALGAPPRLVAAANQDALDEIRHAELCFSLATALDGRRTSPAPFPEAQRVATLSRSRPLALARLAVSSLVDGALHEGVSARIIARLAKRCEVPAIREMLRSIAADEGRHSAHGWNVVAWCLEQGGPQIGASLLGALRGLPTHMRTALPAGAEDGGWERWGIHGHALEAEEYGEALALLNDRVRALVAGAARRAA